MKKYLVFIPVFNEARSIRTIINEIKNFTGIDDPYERPIEPEVQVNTVGKTPKENAREIVDYLLNVGFLQEFNNNH